MAVAGVAGMAQVSGGANCSVVWRSESSDAGGVCSRGARGGVRFVAAGCYYLIVHRSEHRGAATTRASAAASASLPGTHAQ